jgi:glycerophosphoryl diester phosphodiesterase
MAGPLNIAHRGGAALWPENTLAAFAAAVGLGADGAELDVQLSADGAVVVHHDLRLNPGYARLRGGDWIGDPGPRIKDLTLEDLARFAIGRPRPGSDYARAHPGLRGTDGEAIPTLAAVMATVKHAASFRLFIELKCDASDDSADPVALAEAVYDLVSAADFLDRTIFVGFDWRALLAIKACDPSAACWFTTDKLSGDARAAIDIIAAAGAEGWFADFRDAHLRRSL